ncbi:protein VAPYRIN-LIKE-like [Diospyros lotus]|uniref:protein VAPYRIN-LIKE-like n=1 Tax=Diospyros lotus TaxID=55363 RepID=UPI002255E757|nr:protein VAPYRIN-LIKE-like [Diospyros lotus]
MDRLVKPDVKEVHLTFTRGRKCSATFRLSNLMHTMSVAVSLSTTNPSFSFPHPFSILPPLSTASFSVHLHQPSDQPPLSSPPDTILVRSSMLPTGKAHPDDLRRLFSKPGPHVFKDAAIPISLVGPHVVESLFSPPRNKTLEVAFLFSMAVSACDSSDLNSLLRSAASLGNSYFMSALIEAGAAVNHRVRALESVMSLAIQSEQIGSLQVLIEAGYKMDPSLDRFLHEAAKMDRVDLMEIICLGFTDIDMNSTNSRGQTALHVGANRGNVEVLQFLVSMGADPDIADRDGWTPLHCAADEGHEKAVDFLLDCSTFSKYAVNRDGKTAFALAVEKGHSHLYNGLHLGEALHRAARMDDVHSMKSCLAEGAEVNGRDQNGWTPLHRAAFKGRMESVKLLLGHGARVDLLDDSGRSPLQLAAEAGHVQVAMCLTAHGAKASSKVKSLESNLDCFKNHPPFVTSSCQQKERA